MVITDSRRLLGSPGGYFYVSQGFVHAEKTNAGFLRRQSGMMQHFPASNLRLLTWCFLYRFSHVITFRGQGNVTSFPALFLKFRLQKIYIIRYKNYINRTLIIDIFK